MANNFQLIVIIGATLIGSAFILFILTNALAVWSQSNIDSTEITFGLWRQCVYIGDEEIIPCEDLACPSENISSGTCNKILAARVFITLTCILSGICGTLSVIYCAISGDKKLRRLLLTKKILALGSLVTGIIGVALGISGTMTIENITTLRLGDAAIIGIAAVGANLIGTILLLLTKPYF